MTSDKIPDRSHSRSFSCYYESEGLKYSMHQAYISEANSSNSCLSTSTYSLDYHSQSSKSISHIENIQDDKFKLTQNLEKSASDTTDTLSTTFLHITDRPRNLPRKDPAEAQRHKKEFYHYLSDIRRKLKQREIEKEAENERKLAMETRTQELLRLWRGVFIPNWLEVKHNKRVHDIWWEGIPSAVRGQVWLLVIGNPLEITREMIDACLAHSHKNMQRINNETKTHPNFPTLATTLSHASLEEASNCIPNYGNSDESINTFPPPNNCSYQRLSENDLNFSSNSPTIPLSALCQNLQSYRDTSLQIIKLDVSRTFPSLGLFQAEGPYHDDLHNLLAAFVSYQPSLGYLQGMSFLAATLLLAIGDMYQAFIAFATILNRRTFNAFYSLNETEFAVYFTTFDRLMARYLPRLRSHLSMTGLDSRLYLFDWLFTIFSRSLPLEVELRIWDLFFRDGEPILLHAALGILHIFEDRLIKSDFDQLASFLTGQMPSNLTPDDLVAAMRSLNLRKSNIKLLLDDVRKEVAVKSISCHQIFHSESNDKSLDSVSSLQRSSSSRSAYDFHLNAESTFDSTLFSDSNRVASSNEINASLPNYSTTLQTEPTNKMLIPKDPNNNEISLPSFECKSVLRKRWKIQKYLPFMDNLFSDDWTDEVYLYFPRREAILPVRSRSILNPSSK